MLALSHSFPPSFLTGHEGNMGEIGRSMKKLEICRKNSMMKILIEHHFAGIPKGRRSDRCFFSDRLKFIYTKLVQNYIDGLDYIRTTNHSVRSLENGSSQ